MSKAACPALHGMRCKVCLMQVQAGVCAQLGKGPVQVVSDGQYHEGP